jgi:hypothetical protein
LNFEELIIRDVPKSATLMICAKQQGLYLEDTNEAKKVKQDENQAKDLQCKDDA